MKRICRIIPIVSLLIVVFMTYANSVDDLDFWWHLKHGQLIYETHSIPEKDFFSFTTDIPEHISKIGKKEDAAAAAALPYDELENITKSIIKISWLSQLIFYITYLLGGFTGIGILKSAVFVLTFIVMYLTMRKSGADYLSSFFVICLVAFIGIDFNYTRPQIFSFLLFSCLFYILYDFKKTGKLIFLLPVLMFIWANLHGGFVLGVLVIIVFFSSEAIKHAVSGRYGEKNGLPFNKGYISKLGLFSVVSILASLLNPNSLKTFLLPWYQELRISVANIEEYSRPMLYEYHAFWFMLFLVVLSALIMVRKKRLDITDLIISIAVIIPSLMSIRYIIFFALGTGVLLAYSITCIWSGIMEWKISRRLLERSWFSGLNLKLTVPFLLSVISVLVLIKISVSDRVLEFDMREGRYPSGAVNFLQEHKPAGNMFNLYNWGGYLIWSLYPEYRVFIDGRTLNETVFYHYSRIINAEEGDSPDIPLWKRLLDAYEVNLILTSAVSSKGYVLPLTASLYLDKDWELVYTDGKSMLFLRAVQENSDIIRDLYISKDRVFDEIISECLKGIDETPATWGYYETLGFTYMKKSRYEEALAMFRKYLAMNPGNKKVRDSYNLLKRYLEKYDTKGSGGSL